MQESLKIVPQLQAWRSDLSKLSAVAKDLKSFLPLDGVLDMANAVYLESSVYIAAMGALNLMFVKDQELVTLDKAEGAIKGCKRLKVWRYAAGSDEEQKRLITVFHSDIALPSEFQEELQQYVSKVKERTSVLF